VPDGDKLIVGIRPESFEDVAFAERRLPELDVTVAVLEEVGSDAHVIFEVDAPRVETEQLRAAAEDDERLVSGSQTSLFNARVDPRTKARVGERLRLAVDPESLYFFGRSTGENLLAAAPAAV
jgi:multiple sugar transport system ATP-binding protein